MRTKYDELRESGKRKRLTYREEEPNDPAYHELWRIENLIEDGRLVEEGSFKGFERYLLLLLLNSGEDNCTKNCAYGSKTELCAAILPDGGMDDTVCFRGIWAKYAARGKL